MPQRYGKEKVLYWASEIDYNTLEQAAKASRLPFIHGHVALMPDAHVGFGTTVGSVIVTDGAIAPSFAGVDLGCGMIATQTIWNASDLPDDLSPLLSKIQQVIPAGVGQGHDMGYKDGYRRTLGTLKTVPHTTFDSKQEQTAITQFGSLGSGNHFVEVCLDENDQVWTVLHSGSRGIGNQLATQHINRAKGMMKEMFISLEDPDLAYLVEGTPEFDAYIADMLWSQEYAMGNREAMNAALQRVLRQTIEPEPRVPGGSHVVQVINCHHNYTEQEMVDGKLRWVTRKGAIKADTGDWGVIPGSMGTDTYITLGRGNLASWNSSSHGAGRKMSRGQAKRELNVSDFKAQMAGKTWQSSNAAVLLDEAPNSYKDIVQVMEDQEDLTMVMHHLHQVLNYKGT
jgi:tRNA-splicing ligase RtcB (3'-phosphate/5'-hydroxy nucleic acid ligase)